ncbi:uncharacterized protein [Amphiura filiformis]|uniref:uncharacterized protein n=1 Tax=Amphiura filiformis TaxID=82378 RepID=UPI003B21B10A
MYHYIDTDKCLACHPSCKTCDGPAPSECLTCDDELKFDDVHGSCHVSCPSHTFFHGGSSGCVHCYEECATCDGQSENDCLTCENGLYLYVDETNNAQCRTACPDGNFHYRPSDDSTDNYECQQCDTSCKTCFGGKDDECTTCQSDMFKEGFTCVTNCEEGLYPDDKNICQQCHEKCETCSGGGNNHCLSCKGDLYWQDGYCVDHCTQGFYLEANGRRCDTCNQRCLDCKDSGVFDCTNCRDSYLLANGTCYNRCEMGKYWKNGTCITCDSTCKECFGPKEDHCITCPDHLNLYRLDVNHSSCVRCCQDGEEASDMCCTCNDDKGKIHSHRLHLNLYRLDVNHSSCVRCCEDGEEASDICCTCNDDKDKCLRSGEGKGGKGGKGGKKKTKNSPSSDHPHLQTGTIVLGVILCIAFFCTVFCVLQARSKKIWCFKGSYDKLPAYYDSKGNHVIMSKQYQHEKINIMSDDEDFYEDIDSEQEEDD